MISGKQNVWDFPAAKFRRACVLRGFEQTGAETIVRRGLFMTKHAGQQAYHCIHQYNRSDRAIREYVVTDGDLCVNEVFNYTMIDPLIMTADDDQMFLLCEFRRETLCETLSLRCHQDHETFFCPQRFHRREDRFRFHHHPLPSAEGRIIDDAMFVGCPIAQIVNVEIDNLIFLGSLHHALAERRAADFRKQSQDVDFHERRTFNVQRPTSNV